jgi:hypothetical protein
MTPDIRRNTIPQPAADRAITASQDLTAGAAADQVGRVTVAVCAYTVERLTSLTALVAGLPTQTRRPDRVLVVVDNCPELLGLLNTMVQEDPELARLVEPVPNTRTRGLTGARNTAVELMRADEDYQPDRDVLVFVDDDAVLEQDWLELLVRPLGDPRVWVVGGQVDPLWTAGRPAWFPDSLLWTVGCSWRGLPDTPGEVRNPIGCSMALRAAVFDTVGGFDETVGRVGQQGQGADETELAVRLKGARPDALIWYEPASRCRQLVPPERANLRYLLRRSFAEGRSKARLVSTLGPEGEHLSRLGAEVAGQLVTLRWRAAAVTLATTATVGAGLAVELAAGRAAHRRQRTAGPATARLTGDQS